MKRSIVSIALSSLLAVSTSYGGVTAEERSPREPGQERSMNWITFASPVAVEESLNRKRTDDRRPVVYLETNAYTYTSGQPISLSITLDPNGYSEPATLFLYKQNRVTGDKFYYNVRGGGFLAAGESADLFGGTSAIPVNLPALTNFNLFGSFGALDSAEIAGTEAGRWQYVLEVRDVAGEIVSRGNAMYAIVTGQEVLAGAINVNRTLTPDKLYVLQGAVFIRAGMTLTIQPGTVILGDKASIGTLVVDRDGNIEANGTEMQPIIMSSDQPVGSRGRGDWGGLIINGRAVINAPGGVGSGEGDTGQYGGTNPNDDSGSLRYVRVEFAGREFSPENELNGIAFQGVGAGTEVDHVQVHFNKDDGVEFFGGSVNAKYVLLTAIGDDMLDWVQGWNGNAQFVLGVQRGDDADNGIEADNEDDNNDLTPRSNPTIYNATLIGGDLSGSESDDGIVLREGTAGKIYNSIIMGFGEVHIAIRDDATFAQAANGSLVVDSNIFFQNAEGYDTDGGVTTAAGQQTRTFVTETMRNNRFVDPMLYSPFTLLMPDVEPRDGSPALDARYVKTPPDNGFFDTTVDYLGAVGPNRSWHLTGWATFSDN